MVCLCFQRDATTRVNGMSLPNDMPPILEQDKKMINGDIKKLQKSKKLKEISVLEI